MEPFFFLFGLREMVFLLLYTNGVVVLKGTPKRGKKFSFSIFFGIFFYYLGKEK